MVHEFVQQIGLTARSVDVLLFGAAQALIDQALVDQSLRKQELDFGGVDSLAHFFFYVLEYIPETLVYDKDGEIVTRFADEGGAGPPSNKVEALSLILHRVILLYSVLSSL